MRVIRPRAISASERRRSLLLASSMIAVGVAAGGLALVTSSTQLTGLMAIVAALGLGIGGAWLARVMRPSRSRRLAGAMADVLAPTFDDTYTLLVSPRLPIRDTQRLDGVLIGPGGVRVLTARDWHGRYRVRGHGVVGLRNGLVPLIAQEHGDGVARNIGQPSRGQTFDHALSSTLPAEAALVAAPRHAAASKTLVTLGSATPGIWQVPFTWICHPSTTLVLFIRPVGSTPIASRASREFRRKGHLQGR